MVKGSFKNILVRIRRKKTLKLYNGPTREASPMERDLTYNTKEMEYMNPLRMPYLRVDKSKEGLIMAKGSKNKTAIPKNKKDVTILLLSVPTFLTTIFS